jgi:Membrane-associated phospholipid phosphatase
MKKLRKIVSKNWKWIICVIAFLIFFLLLKEVHNHDILGIDEEVANFVFSVRNSKLTLFFKGTTMLCDIIFIVGVFLFVLLIVKDWRFKRYLCANIILVVAINNLIKFIVSRDRPLGEHLVDATGFSFPSGHTMTATAMYGLLIYFIYKYVRNKKSKYVLISLLSLVIILIGMSRIYLGVHYTSDVLAGFTLSIAYLIGYVHVMESRLTKKLSLLQKNAKNVEEK